MYTLRLYQDYVPANIECRQIESQHSILYVLREAQKSMAKQSQQIRLFIVRIASL